MTDFRPLLTTEFEQDFCVEGRDPVTPTMLSALERFRSRDAHLYEVLTQSQAGPDNGFEGAPTTDKILGSAFAAQAPASGNGFVVSQMLRESGFIFMSAADGFISPRFQVVKTGFLVSDGIPLMNLDPIADPVVDISPAARVWVRPRTDGGNLYAELNWSNFGPGEVFPVRVQYAIIG